MEKSGRESYLNEKIKLDQEHTFLVECQRSAVNYKVEGAKLVKCRKRWSPYVYDFYILRKRNEVEGYTGNDPKDIDTKFAGDVRYLIGLVM